MTKLKPMTEGAKGFEYSDAPQRSPEWLAIRAPRIGASQLGALMGKGVKGQYLAPRKALLRELAFQKAFEVPFMKFVNEAMQAGTDNEDFVADQYSSKLGVPLAKVGCFYNEHFVASPDRDVVGTDGLVEIKWLFDNAWSEVVEKGEPERDHYLQMQGQMWATGKQWVDYVAGNGNAGKFVVIRVERDEETIKEIAEEVKVVEEIEPMPVTQVFDFSHTAPQPVSAREEDPWVSKR